jgi:hypothetical protein
MAQRALTTGRTTDTRGRALFGLLDAGGWAWATVKAAFWFILIIFILAYIPDRAYYFTVNKTLDLGILAWSPINFCPPENRTLPCPAPVGALVPWDNEPPPEVLLPEPRTDGTVVQLGTKLLFIASANPAGATDSVLVSQTSGVGNLDAWTEGPRLPEPRADAGVIASGGRVFVIGGFDEDGEPTKDAFVLTPDAQTGSLGEWKRAADLKLPIDLPEPRGAGALAAAGDALLFVGGEGPDGPTKTVWKAKFDASGDPGEWVKQAGLFEENADGTAAFVGDFLWLAGGRNASGPTATVQRGITPAAAGAQTPTEVPGASGAPAGAEATVTDASSIARWSVSTVTNLPGPRDKPAGWTATGTLYVAGGRTADGIATEVYWATPDVDGNFTQWTHVPESDMRRALYGGAAVVNGPNVIIVGGSDANGPVRTLERANTGPQPPFFQLGILGATVPGLAIGGAIGQQLGYLNAAGAGTLNFAILIFIGILFAAPDKLRFFRRFRRERR